MRRRDLRLLQGALASRGLSSLGRAESQAMESIDAVLAAVRSLRGIRPHGFAASHVAGIASGWSLLDSHTRALLGPPPAGRDIRIMVTMPSEAADDGELIEGLLTSGMDCMRINAAHDGPEAWERMLHHLEAARTASGKPCRVIIDLAGPKLRTGPIQAGSPVIRWRPVRDGYGRVVHPARVWLTALHEPRIPSEPPGVVLLVTSSWLSSLSIGDVIKLFDARGSMRSLEIVAREEGRRLG